MKQKLKEVFHVGPGFMKKSIIMVINEFLTGFFMAILVEVSLGTDPYTFLNVTISEKIGMSFGNWQVLFNLGLLVFVVLTTRLNYMGVGTLANMIILGYACDFGRWFFRRILPASAFTDFPVRGILFAFGLLFFAICCGVYMNLNMGVSPYDAIPMIISDRLSNVPFFIVRMCWDFGMIAIGVLLGGIPPVGCFFMALFLGPIVGFIGRQMMRIFPA